jgi:hypothetical protein
MLPGQLDMFRKDRKGKPKPVKLDPYEYQIQIDLIQLLHLQARREIEYWHTPNGELRDKRHAAKLKAMGTRPGVADLMFLFHDTAEVPVLFLELKARNGKLSDNQEHFRNRVRALGYAYEWTDSFDDAVRILRKYHVLRVKR